MGYQNVEVIEQQQAHQKTWFNRFKTKIGVAITAATAMVVTQGSNAFLAAADVTEATTGAGGEAVLKQAGIWVLSIAVGLAVVLKIISLDKK